MIEIQDIGVEGTEFEGLAIEEIAAEYEVLLARLHELPELDEAREVAARMKAITEEILRRFGLDEAD